MMKNITILVIDDEENIRWLLQEGLTDDDITVRSAADRQSGIRELASGDIDVCFVDIFLQEDNGIELVSTWAKEYPATHFVIITAQNTSSNIIDAMKAGAIDFYPKPFDLDEMRNKVKSIAGSKPSRMAEAADVAYDFETRNKKMLEIYKLIGKIAQTNINILIEGESGTGKEVIAKMIHAKSNRAAMPFIPINMAAIPSELLESELFGHMKGSYTGATADKKGKFEEAGGGTIFLDEISEMDFSLQSKLLRVLQEREITRVGSSKGITLDVRIIAATNKNLEQQVRQNNFREDLFYRLNVVSFELPPLRERKEDISYLISYFLKKYDYLKGRTLNMSKEAMQVLTGYSWPGNIRELENVIQYALVNADTDCILPANLPEKLLGKGAGNGSRNGLSDELFALAADLIESEILSENNLAYQEYQRITEIPLIRAALNRTSGNKSVAAKVLGINRNTLRKKIKDYGIE